MSPVSVYPWAGYLTKGLVEKDFYEPSAPDWLSHAAVTPSHVMRTGNWAGWLLLSLGRGNQIESLRDWQQRPRKSFRRHTDLQPDEWPKIWKCGCLFNGHNMSWKQALTYEVGMSSYDWHQFDAQGGKEVNVEFWLPTSLLIKRGRHVEKEPSCHIDKGAFYKWLGKSPKKWTDFPNFTFGNSSQRTPFWVYG